MVDVCLWYMVKRSCAVLLGVLQFSFDGSYWVLCLCSMWNAYLQVLGALGLYTLIIGLSRAPSSAVSSWRRKYQDRWDVREAARMLRHGQFVALRLLGALGKRMQGCMWVDRRSNTKSKIASIRPRVVWYRHVCNDTCEGEFRPRYGWMTTSFDCAISGNTWVVMAGASFLHDPELLHESSTSNGGQANSLATRAVAYAAREPSSHHVGRVVDDIIPRNNEP